MKKWLSKAIISLIALLIMGYIGVVIGYNLNSNKAQPVNSSKVAATTCSLSSEGLLKLINQERAKKGAPKLTVDPRLVKTSQQKLDKFISEKYVGHDTPSGVPFDKEIRQAGISGQVSEDMGYGARSNKEAMAFYKSSPLHYDSLISPIYSYVGISTNCNVNYIAQTDTMPSVDGDQTGNRVTSLDVIHLAQ
jgi:uncharacterized protein YkwD